MKLHFVNHLEELNLGINELCQDLDVTVSEEGMEVFIQQNPHSPLCVC